MVLNEEVRVMTSNAAAMLPGTSLNGLDGERPHAAHVQDSSVVVFDVWFN